MRQYPRRAEDVHIGPNQDGEMCHSGLLPRGDMDYGFRLSSSGSSYTRLPTHFEKLHTPFFFLSLSTHGTNVS